MRTSLSRTTIMMMVAASLAAFSVTGCQTTSASKSPSSSWFSWGKKKPASTTLSANTTKPSSGLPAPPSSAASPNPVPSYAQDASRAGFGGGAMGSGMPNANPAGTAAGYGSAGAGAGHYANASYGNNSATPAGADTAAAYGRAASPGAYAPAGYPSTSGQQGPAAGYAAAANGYISAGAQRATGVVNGLNSTYGAATGQSPYAGAAAPSDRAQAWAGNGAESGAVRGGAAMPAYDSRPAPAGAYGQRGGQEPAVGGAYSGGAAGAYGQAPAPYGSTNGGAYGSAGAAPAQESTPQGAAYAGVRSDAAGSLNAGGYRPGSTGHATRFGDSQQINVNAADSVQSASYNTARDANARAVGSDQMAPSGNQPAGSDYDAGNAPQGRTANGGGAFPLPGAYQR